MDDLYDYMKHIYCDCGGVIGQYERDGYFRCSLCGKQYKWSEIHYDDVEINPKTGWVFPMKKKSQ